MAKVKKIVTASVSDSVAKKVSGEVATSVADAVSDTVSDYFAKVGSRDEVFSTSDGYIFENQGFARNHAATLEDKNIVPHINGFSVEVEDEEEEEGGAGTAATQDVK
jgi:hypothetical protein